MNSGNKNKNNQAGKTAELKKQVRKEINRNKVDIDRSVFTKTEDEKSRLKLEKKLYKQYLQSM